VHQRDSSLASCKREISRPQAIYQVSFFDAPLNTVDVVESGCVNYDFRPVARYCSVHMVKVPDIKGVVIENNPLVRFQYTLDTSTELACGSGCQGFQAASPLNLGRRSSCSTSVDALRRLEEKIGLATLFRWMGRSRLILSSSAGSWKSIHLYSKSAKSLRTQTPCEYPLGT
jgi:hypothetical protein